MLKIDLFNHILPQKCFDRIYEINPNLKDIGKRMKSIPVLTDVDLRLKQLEEFGDDYRQVISLAAPPPELVGTPEDSVELCRIANDEMAKVVERDDRFLGFIASVPMDNEGAIASEIDYAIKDLGAKGVQVFTNVRGAALDKPEFSDLFERMAHYDLPIWVHPARTAAHPDYVGEDRSWYEIWWTFGWPYETSVMMARLIYSGYFDQYPDLKVITHHLGGNTPFHGGRVGPGNDQLGART
ncbi:MAG: amidohydrolase family protein, partial [Chloroflexota bacterium]